MSTTENRHQSVPIEQPAAQFQFELPAYISLAKYGSDLPERPPLQPASLREPVRLSERPLLEPVRLTDKIDVYVAGLAPHVTARTLRRACSAFGATAASILSYANGVSRCSGFVSFQNLAAAQWAIERMNGQYIPAIANVPLTMRLADNVKNALSRKPQNSTRFAPYASNWAPAQTPRRPALSAGVDLFVSGVPYAANQAWLTGVFSSHGQVISVRIPYHHRGYGFVTMASLLDAISAIEALNGARTSCGQVLDVKLSTKN